MHGQFKEDLRLREIEMYADYGYLNVIVLARKAREWHLQANVAALCLYAMGIRRHVSRVWQALTGGDGCVLEHLDCTCRYYILSRVLMLAENVQFPESQNGHQCCHSLEMQQRSLYTLLPERAAHSAPLRADWPPSQVLVAVWIDSFDTLTGPG